MPLRVCDYDAACSQPAERKSGSCIICSSHYCATHEKLPFHTCPSENEDPDSFYAAYDNAKETLLLDHLRRVNSVALATIASGLRGGIACTIPTLDADDMTYATASLQTGGQNCNLDIVFEDGVTWLARIRLNDPSLPPPAVQQYIFRSEVATLHWLRKTGALVPKVFKSAIEGASNPVGVTFLLMEKLKGRALDWSEASSAQKTKVMEQLAVIFLELEKHTLQSTGSFIPSSAGSSIGAYAQSHYFESITTSIGPFNDLPDALQAMISRQKQQILTGEISTFALDLYLSHLWREGILPQVVSTNDTTGFYLKHNDDKGDHIMVDEQFKITGIIDWEFASTEAKGYAFGSPCMMWPVLAFYEGSNELSPEEKEFAEIFHQLGREDMAAYVREGRKMQRFTWFLNGGTAVDLEEFKALFDGERRIWAEEAGEKFADYDDWKSMMLQQHAEDDGLMCLLQREST